METVIKLEVNILKEGTFEGSQSVQGTLASALKIRAAGLAMPSSEEFQFSDRVKKAIKKIFKLFQSIQPSKLSIPSNIEEKLADFGIKKETISTDSADDFLQKMRSVIMHDPLVFVRLLVSQGFDLWFTQSCFPVCDLKKVGLNFSVLRDVESLKNLRKLVEYDFCKGRSLVQELDPDLLRLIHTIEDRSEVQQFPI